MLVKVYTTNTCYYCTKLKDYLKQNNIEFKEIDVSKDAEEARKLVETTHEYGVPQTFIKKNKKDNGAWVIGFDRKKIDKILGIS